MIKNMKASIYDIESGLSIFV